MEPIPAHIGRYVVESLVGAGGMGQIYKAHDPDIRRTVAIKLISTRLMSSSDRSEYMRRFRREAEAAARCAHPNIVAIYDFALHEGQPFLAMEFVHGMSVRQIIDEKPMAVPDAIQVMLQVLDALASAHEQGVIHQDVKPANIMLTPQGRAKVADFGISRFANADLTSISSSMGTPNYMAPEQCRGGTVDHRADLFAAGATLFEMVAGERAFAGRSTAEVTHRIMNERLPLLPAAVRAEAPRLQFVLERAMGKQREDRFDSGHEMAEALRQVLAACTGGACLQYLVGIDQKVLAHGRDAQRAKRPRRLPQVLQRSVEAGWLRQHRDGGRAAARIVDHSFEPIVARLSVCARRRGPQLQFRDDIESRFR